MSSPDCRAKSLRPRACASVRERSSRVRGRTVFPLGGDLISSYFLDDRADLVAWLLAIERRHAAFRDLRMFFGQPPLRKRSAAKGALFLMHKRRPDICVWRSKSARATPDAPFPIDANPTVWVTDSYSTMDPRDLDAIDTAASALSLRPHYQAVTRGGSDASCAASHGLCARPVTLAFAGRELAWLRNYASGFTGNARTPARRVS